MNIEARTWLTILTVSLFGAAGCGDSQAPAMTRATESATTRATEPAVDPEDSSTSPADVPAPDATGSSLPGAETPESAATPPGKRQTEPAESLSPPDRLRDISFDDIKFDISKGDPFERSLLTDKIEALDGTRVRIRGYILPSFQQTGLTQFVLVRDNLSCCFGPGAAIYDCVIVEMKPGRSTDYSLYPVAVDGTFTIREMLDPEGKAVAIYHLDGEQVR